MQKCKNMLSSKQYMSVSKEMKNHKIITDKDFGKEMQDCSEFKYRQTARGIIWDGDKMAIIKSHTWDSVMLPGGGIDEGENPKDAMQREAREELGCEIVEVDEVASVTEKRTFQGLEQVSHFFTAKKRKDLGGTSLDEHEIRYKLETIWCTLEQAKEMINANFKKEDDLGLHFMTVRDLHAIEVYEEMVSATKN